MPRQTVQVAILLSACMLAACEAETTGGGSACVILAIVFVLLAAGLFYLQSKDTQPEFQETDAVSCLTTFCEAPSLESGQTPELVTQLPPSKAAAEERARLTDKHRNALPGDVLARLPEEPETC